MNLFSFIKSHTSIVTVVSDYVTLKKIGFYLKGSCPFHQEKTASFTVSPHKEIFYCFGCHVGGDVIKFIENIEHCSPLEAAHYLAERYNITIPEELTRDQNKNSANQEAKKGYHALCYEVANWCNERLQRSTKAQTYLSTRGITQESIKRFNLGYFPSGTRAIKDLCAYIQRSSFLMDDLLNAQIITMGKGNISYAPFEERIIFPIKDHLGNYCGFGGRVFMPHDKRAKYYNSHENEFFAKGSLLYGLDLAKKEIQKQDAAILVEGYTDCIALAQHGFANSLATLGTSCTTDHLKIISRHAQQLYVMYDGDQAGQKAIIRLTELCWNVNLELKIICLPLSDDPASFCARGGDINALIGSARDIFTFFIETMGVRFAAKTLNEKLQLAQRVLELIMHVAQPLKRELLVNQAAGALGLPVELIKKELAHRTKKAQPSAPKNVESLNVQNNTTAQLFAPISKVEQSLCAILLSHFELIKHSDTQLAINYFDPNLKEIVKKAGEMHAKNETLGFMEFFDAVDQTQQHTINYLMMTVGKQAPKEMFEYFIEQFHKKHWHAIAHDVKEKLKVAQHAGDLTEVQKILSSFQEMKKKLRERNMLWREPK